MGILIVRSLLFSGLILMFSSAYAQSSSEDKTSLPPISKPPVKITLHYLSVFSRYIPYKEQPVLPWQEANDKAEEIGGWRFYAREGNQPDKDDKPLEPKPAETKQPATPVINNEQHHEHRSKP